MALQETVKKLFEKALKVGTPPEKEVLYKEVIKRKVPKESAETLFVNNIKHSFSKALTITKEKLQIEKDTDTLPSKEKGKTKHATKKTPAKKKTTTRKKTATKKSSAKKTTSTKKESAEKKTTSKKTVTKKSVAKKPATKKKTSPTKKETSKKAEKIALYIKDIKKHYGEADEDFVAIIVKNLGPAIYRKNAELVSCSNPKELDTVRRNFLTKKLGIDASKAVLDAAIQDVCEELKGARTKYRATFYYRLAKKFKKESFLS